MDAIDTSNRRLRCKRLIGRFWRRLPRIVDRRVVLIYHSVGSGPASAPEAMFRNQMAWLAEHADVATLDELVKNPGKGGLRVALTFDDGYRSLCRVVAPVLRAYSFPATVYLNTGWIAEETPRCSDASLGHYPDEEFLIWKEVAELAGAGWEVGSHGIEHYDLTALPVPEVERQIMESKGDIEARLGRPCRHFAYTWGLHNENVRERLRSSGYRFAVAAHHAPLSDKSDLFALPRVDIRRDYNLDDFTALVRGEWDFLGLLHKLRGMKLRVIHAGSH